MASEDSDQLDRSFRWFCSRAGNLRRLADDADGEASFSVYETKDPTDRDQPFLLVFRTVRIVTANASHRSGKR
jgi:hypothetical protein